MSESIVYIMIIQDHKNTQMEGMFLVTWRYVLSFHIHATQANHEASVPFQAILVGLECATALSATHACTYPVIQNFQNILYCLFVYGLDSWIVTMDIPADWTPSQRFSTLQFETSIISQGISVFPKHCVAGKVVLQVFMDMECCFYLSRHIYKHVELSVPIIQSMRIFLFLALSEAQALLAKSLAPSQTPEVQKLRWLAKAETVASIVFVCDALFSPNFNQLQNSERSYSPYKLTKPHCLKHPQSNPFVVI